MDETRSTPGSRRWAVLAVVLAVVGVVALVVAVTGQQTPPQPPAAAAGASTGAASTVPTPAPPPSGAPPAGPPAAEPVQPPAEPVPEPVSVQIPSIGVTSDLLRLGLQPDGTVEVPPLVEDDQAGWYQPGPAPGAVGPAVLLGHVDSAEHGPGVFFELGALRPGAEVTVTRADGSVAVFAVDRVERYPKDDFPTLEVYGNTAGPELRLITCGGDFDSGARSYEDNIVAYASLIGTTA